MQKLFGTDRVFGGTLGRFAAADKGGVRDRGDRPDPYLYRAAILTRGFCCRDHRSSQEAAMKVVVLDHPKILGFFLRRIYGIKKVKDVHQ